jgi:muconolactone delta-isomerase
MNKVLSFEQKKMNITAVILTIKEEIDLSQLGEVLKREQEAVKVWKEQGIIHDIYLRQGRKGAVIMFPEMDEASVQTLIETLPLYPYFKPAEFLGLIKNS